MSKSTFKNFVIPAVVLCGLLLGAAVHLRQFGPEFWDKKIWLASLIIGALPPVYRLIRDLLRGHFGVDIIALLAIISSLVLGQYLAGAVIVLMLSGGEALENFALRRARRELSRLLARAPQLAHVKDGGQIRDIPAAALKAGETFVVKPGEVVPADGLVLEGISDLDESAITGEPLPAQKRPGSRVFSGSINKDGALEIKADKTAKDSTYENIIKLVKAASESRAPVVRLADRYSVWFTAVTLVLAAAAWFISHDPVRLLAVLVVATPCPLILATPIAIMSGISRSASRGIIVKSGASLETLADTDAFIFDKTGTLTLGEPRVVEIRIHDRTLPAEKILHLAASLDQMSGHILARALLKYARNDKNIRLDFPENFKETFGEGVSGKIGGQTYLFGRLSFLQNGGVHIPQEILNLHHQRQEEGIIAVYLGVQTPSLHNERVGGILLGSVLFADEIRPEIKTLFRDIAGSGISHIVMLTGDKLAVAEKIGKQLGLDDIHAESLPEQKLAEIKDHQRQFGKVAMVGDGINDAPALAAADVGIAIGGSGGTASSESGDIVITVNNLARVGQALKIAKGTIKIAKQSILIGIGVSILLMLIAAAGHIAPVYGALLQEALDVAVILNALRVNFVKI